MPKYSVVLATYNRPLLLPRALGTVARQTVKDFEVIVVNDGGCDVAKIIDVVRKYIPNLIYIIHEKNRGCAAAYNTAIRAATGERIVYQSDDDVWFLKHLQAFEEGMEDYPVAYSDNVRVNCEEIGGNLYNFSPQQKEYSQDFDAALLKKVNYIPQSCYCHRRDIIERIGFYDESLPVLVDWDFFRRAAMAGYPFKHIPIVTGEYWYPLDDKGWLSGLLETNPVEWHRCRDMILKKGKIK